MAKATPQVSPRAQWALGAAVEVTSPPCTEVPAVEEQHLKSDPAHNLQSLECRPPLTL